MSEVTNDPDPGAPRSSPPAGEMAAEQAVVAAVRFWWVSMLRGAFALLLGLGAFFSGATQQTLISYIAIYWLLGGLVTVRWALGVRWRAGTRLGLAAGVLATCTGLVLLARHALAGVVSTEVLVNLVAVTTIATGALRLAGAFEIEEHTAHRWTIGGVILGTTEIGIGLALLLLRDATASTLRTTLGVWGLAAGILLLMQGLRLLRVRRTMRAGDAAAT